jgi:hypothetical protein
MGHWMTGGSRTETPCDEGYAGPWMMGRSWGHTAGEADPFCGYYTLHFLKDGKVDGMLSVNGATGDVWYHNWHGNFVTMIVEEEETPG